MDRKLLTMLRDDARQSFRRLAQAAGSTVPTVASRIRRMEELGIILGYTVQLDPARFGASREADVDLDGPAKLPCHTCGQETDNPHWATLDGKRHPFCCIMCRSAYLEKYETLRKGLEGT